MLKSSNRHFFNFTSACIVPPQTGFILGAGCAFGCVPLWNEVLANLLEKIEDIIGYAIPASEISTERKEPIIRLLKEYANKANHQWQYGYSTHEKLDSISRKSIDLLYLCELLHGWKFLCKYPNRNPYNVFKLAAPDSPIVNYNQDHLIHLLGLPNKIFEPHGSIFKVITTPMSFNDFQTIDRIDGSSKASDLHKEIEDKERRLLELAAIEADRFLYSDNRYDNQLSPNFVMPGDVESNLFLPKYGSNMSEIIGACLGYRAEIWRIQDSGKAFENLLNRHGSEVAGEVLKIINEDCNADVWMTLIDSLKTLKRLVVIGFSFSDYDFGIIQSMKSLSINPHIVLIDPNSLQIRDMLSYQLKNKNIWAEPLDWLEYYEFMNAYLQSTEVKNDYKIDWEHRWN